MLAELEADAKSYFQAIMKVRGGKKPPVLEGDMNFIEMNFPELTFVRVKTEKGSVPCLATASGIGDIYFCPDVSKYTDRIHSVAIICNKFKFKDIEEEYCYLPCLLPAGGRYYPPVPLEYRPEAEPSGVCARVKVKPVDGVFTDYGTEMISQFVAIKEFLTGDPDLSESVGENVLASVLYAIDDFVKNNDICDHEDGEKFLREWEDKIFGVLGRATLERILPREIFEKDMPLLSCKYLQQEHWWHAYYPFNIGAANRIYFQELRWSNKYETKEFAEKLAKAKEREHLNPLSFESLEDFLLEIHDDAALKLIDELHEFEYKQYYDVYDELYGRLSGYNCWKLAGEIGFDEEICRKIEKYEKLLDKMRKHEPMPGMEEEYREKIREYESELEALGEAIDEAIHEHVSNMVESYIRYLRRESYEDLLKTTKSSDDRIEQGLAKRFAEFLEKICSSPEYFHYCMEASAELTDRRRTW